jgi:hypothetical protein
MQFWRSEICKATTDARFVRWLHQPVVFRLYILRQSVATLASGEDWQHFLTKRKVRRDGRILIDTGETP